MRNHYKIFIGIRELCDLIFFNCLSIPFSYDTVTSENNIPLLDDVDDGEKVSTFRAIHFSSYSSCYTEVSIISEITINSAS